MVESDQSSVGTEGNTIASQAIPSPLKTLAVLAILCRAAEPIGLSEIAGALDVPRPTAHRLLTTLVAARWVIATGHPRRYLPSWRIVELGFNAAIGKPVRSTVIEVLRDFAPRVAPYPMLLVFYEDGDIVVSDAVEVRSGRVVSRLVGGRIPAAISSAGRIYLAYQDTEDVERVLEQHVAPRTEWTKTDADQVRYEIACARQQGYAVVDRELEPTSSGISVPIFKNGEVVAMIGLSSIAGSVSRDVLDEVLSPLLEAASAASNALGNPMYS